MSPTKFDIYASNTRGNENNTLYPFHFEINGVDDLKKALKFDHTCYSFKKNKRCKANLIKANADFYDCDNAPANKNEPDIPPDKWKSPADIDAMFPNVESYTVWSRNHMKEKNGRPARPKFHKYYPRRKPLTNAEELKAFNEAVQKYCPAFDNQALDAARFIYGVEKPIVEYVPGELTIDEFMEQRQKQVKIPKQVEIPKQAALPDKTKFRNVIPAGHRNSTLSSDAFSLLRLYGEDDGKAYTAYMQTADKCSPPLEDKELQTIWNSALKGYREKVITDPTYIAPQIFAAKPDDYSDVGQARVLVEQNGHIIRYNEATGWIAYDEKKWAESYLQAQRLSQELTDRQLEGAKQLLKNARSEEDAAIEEGDKEKERKAKMAVKAAMDYRNYVLGRRKTSRIAATLTEAEPMAEIAVTELDKDAFLLNTPEGTVDLRTGEIRSHDPLDFITKMTSVSPSNVGEEIWNEFLNRLTCGDQGLQEYHQIVAGMCAIGKVFVENLIIAYGSGGNGKSSFYNALSLVMGDYAGSLSAETLTVNCRKNKSPEYAELRGKRLIIAAELEEGMRLDTSIVKKLCSTDPIKAEKKFKAPFDFIPSHTTILYTNHLPKVGTNDSGTWDRLVVVPFNARFRGMDGQIYNYAEYLLENAGGAILSWIIEGARKFIKAGYHIEQPEAVRKAIEEYRQQNDWFHNFINERCEVGAFTEGSQEMYLDYRSYCDEVGEYKRSAAEFKNEMIKAGFKWHRTGKGAIYHGIHLISEFLQE